MIEKLNESQNNGGEFRDLTTGLSKAFDWLHHEVLTAKLSAYGF